jgi:hypothetical protein
VGEDEGGGGEEGMYNDRDDRRSLTSLYRMGDVYVRRGKNTTGEMMALIVIHGHGGS